MHKFHGKEYSQFSVNHMMDKDSYHMGGGHSRILQTAHLSIIPGFKTILINSIFQPSFIALSFGRACHYKLQICSKLMILTVHEVCPL